MPVEAQRAIASMRARLRQQSMLLGKRMADPRLAADEQIQSLKPRLYAVLLQLDTAALSQNRSDFSAHRPPLVTLHPND